MQTVLSNETLKTLNVMVSIDYNSNQFGNARVNKTDTLGPLKIGDMTVKMSGKILIFSTDSTKANTLTQQLIHLEINQIMYVDVHLMKSKYLVLLKVYILFQNIDSKIINISKKQYVMHQLI